MTIENISAPEPKPEHNTKITAIVENKRQQDKIIKIFETGNFDLLNEVGVEVTESERKEFIKKLKSDEITNDAIEKLLAEIQPPAESKNVLRSKDLHEQDAAILKLQEKIKENGLQTVFEFIVKKGILPPGAVRREGPLSPDFIKNILEQFPTPNKLDVFFGSQEKQIRENLEKPENIKSDMASYQRAEARSELQFFIKNRNAIERFNQLLYGKRREYWDQIKLMKK